MKLLIFILLNFTTTLAMASQLLTNHSLSTINLDGLKILNADHQDTLLYRFKKVSHPSLELRQFIENKIQAKPISKIWTLATESNFKNILAFVACPQDSEYFQLFIILLNSSGSTFVQAYSIVDASPESLDLVYGPIDQLESFKVIGEGPLFF